MDEEVKSLWIETTKTTNYPELKDGTRVDVAIVGGGIAGLNAAYFLSRKQLTTAVIEASRIATGTSGFTTAKVTSQHFLKYKFLKDNFGNAGAKIYAKSNQWAIEKLESIVKKESIECDFHRTPAYVYARTDKGVAEIKDEFEATRNLDLPSSFVDAIESFPFKIKGALKFDNQAVFHPRKYLLKIADLITQNSGHIFEQTRALDIKEKRGECDVLTDKGSIKAKWVIVATNFPFYDKGLFFARLGQERSYALATKLNGKMPTGVFINKDDLGISIRPQIAKDNEWLIIGGEEHQAGADVNTSDCYKRLIHKAQKRFDIKSIDFRWSAQDSTSIDRVPYIGKMPFSSNVLVTTGFGEWGMTTSFVSAKILTDTITNKHNDWADLYNPSRIKPLASIKKAVNIGKTSIKGYLSYLNKSNQETDDLTVNKGKVITQNGKKVAVFKDTNGNLHKLSAVCTHMGCVVNINNAEKTWDCPCHGSRFSLQGKVIRGPATKDLEMVD